MTNKILGIAALIGAPFLCINTYVHVPDPNAHVYITDSLSGFFDLLYISGWLCSLIGLHRLGAIGNDRFGRIIVPVALASLVLADVWNVYEMVLPNHDTLLYHILDMFWPISNVVMIGVGIAVIRAKKLSGWKRYVPLLCGLWLPVTVLVSLVMQEFAFAISNGYTAVAWMLLAVVVLITEKSVSEDTDEYMHGLETAVY